MSAQTENDTVAFVFPGVGIDLCGHEAEFIARHQATVSPYLAQASARAHVDLEAAIQSGSLLRLDDRARELLAYGFNCAAAAVYRKAGIAPAFLAGHSLGIYSAITVGEALSFEDGLGLVEKAHACVRAVCEKARFGMAVIVGLSVEEIGGMLDCDAYNGICVANRNNATSLVLTGLRSELEAFMEEAERHGALKAAMLPVEAPYHHPLWAAPASNKFRHHLMTLSWQASVCPIVSSIDGSLLTQPGELLELTAANLSSPICWQGVVEALGTAGTHLAIECGLGISLTQNARFIPSSPKHVNVKTSQWRLGI
jgi:[acyl-carrier-protein] S-malonyltransferase